MIAGVGEVIGLVGDRQPHAGLGAVVQHDLFGQPAAEIILEEQPVRLDVDGKTVEVVEAAHIDAAGRKALRLVLQRRFQLRRRLIPFGLVIELDDMSVRIAAAKRGPCPRSPSVQPISWPDPFSAATRRSSACGLRGAKRHVLHAGGFRRRQLEGVALVIIPAAQIDGFAFAAADGHAHHIDKRTSSSRPVWA